MTTKQNIIDYIIKYKEENGENLKKADAVKIFKRKDIENLFNTWVDALIKASVQTDRSAKIVNCKVCNKEFKKCQKEIDKSKNNFCTKTCAVTFNNKHRVRTEETNIKTSNSLKKYIIENTNKMLREDQKKLKNNTIINKGENKEFIIIKGKKILIKIKNCTICSKEFKTPFNRKTCSEECLKIKNTQSGLKSQASQPRRSKGEILFYELCCKYFKNKEVLSNPQIFIDKVGNKWDLDIVIPSYRIGVAYSGIYHYQQIGKKHNLKQVQSRDIIKKKIVFNNSYVYYEVKDMGRFNPDFVYQEFHKFIFTYFIHLELLMKGDI